MLLNLRRKYYKDTDRTMAEGIKLSYCFNIAPFDGDWKDSLIKVEHKCSSKCTSGAQVKEHIIHIEDFAPPHPTGFMSESQLKRMFEHKEEE